MSEATEELTVLRALGADPVTTTADGLVGILGAVVLGSLLAVVIAVAISPIAPLGPVRLVYPTKGFSADWMVLGVGLFLLIGGLGAIAVVFAYRHALATTFLAGGVVAAIACVIVALSPERRLGAARG